MNGRANAKPSFLIEASLTPSTSFGECRNSQGNPGTDKLFTGQRLDDTGLYYYGARYYDASIGRFISADIIVQNPGNPQTLNRYSYVLNNPLKYFDPTGNIVDFYDPCLDYITQTIAIGFEINVYYIQDLLDLVAAWDLFSQTAAGAPVAAELENSPNVITFRWQGASSWGNLTWGDNEWGSQTIVLDNDLKNDSIEHLALVMAHEAYHAREGNLYDSIQEEIGAYQFQFVIGMQLGLPPTDPYQAFTFDLFFLDRNNLKDQRWARDYLIQNSTGSAKSVYALIPYNPPPAFARGPVYWEWRFAGGLATPWLLRR